MEVIKANYEVFPDKAKAIEGYGKDLYDCINSAYTKVASMNGVWKGVRYGKLASSFNEIVADLNKIIEDVATDIPETLRKIASNYGNFDTEGFSGGTAGAASKISELNVPGDTAIYFDDAAVETFKTNIKDDFSKAKTKITAAKNVISGMINAGDWAGQAADTCMTKIDGYESKVNTDLDSLITEFETCIKETIADITAAENANTI